ncbi:helix-turn-helix domain-containing protein [Caloranaerobacter ferrireducens]|uniref:helix-turn-helix domain-containing protein n=1 Tax=Caloranaerobacter ferrireducens TaxID=1323370 RepID=UPI00084D2DB2|nr:helix-turn-helix domain-containing protein [Caloranaerobacter ferrireducens]
MNNLSLGQKIKKARLEKNLTQKEVAGDFITRNMLSKIENDIAKPSIKTLEYLAKRLDKPISYFLESLVNINHKERSNTEVIFEHSSFLLKNKEYDKCINYIENIIANSLINTYDIYYGRILYILSNCYKNVGKLAKAKKYIHDCIDILKKHKNYYYLAKSYFDLSYIYHKNDDHKETEESVKIALDYYEKSNIYDVLFEIKLYYSLGYALAKQEKHIEAITALSYTLEISESNKCFYNTGEIHMLLGLVYKFQNNLSKAIYHTKKALKFFDFLEHSHYKASCQKNLGNFYILYGNYEKGRSILNTAIKYFESINDNIKINDIRISIFGSLVKEGAYSKAIEYAEKIDIEVVSINDKADFFKNLGKAYLSTNKIEKAKKYLFEAEKLAIESKKYNKLYDVYTYLSELYSLEENYKEAYNYSNKAKEILEESLKTKI